MQSIIELEEEVNKLPPKEKRRFKAIFDVSTSEGKLKIPDSFRQKVLQYFGKKNENEQIIEAEKQVLKRLCTQKIVRTFNRRTREGALFNGLRATRPGMRGQDIAIEKGFVYKHIKEALKNCDLCEPEKLTSEDTFGRVLGKHCTTGANIAKYDAAHGMLIFNRHNPLEFSREELSDYIEVGFKWFEKARKANKEFEYPFFMWNCLGKAGASQVHGHAHLLVGKGMHYAKVEVLREAIQEYKQKEGGNYFDDLFGAHESVELALAPKNSNVRILVYVTPTKEKETMIISPKPVAESDDAKKAIFKTLRCFIDNLGVTCFNLTVSMPALRASKSHPHVVRVVDRGSMLKATSDVAGMELYASNVIASDPCRVIEALKECF